MPKSQDKKTTAENLEEKFDRGEDVLDYFDVGRARVITPQSKGSAAQAKSAAPLTRNSRPAAVVLEKSARYRKKTG